MLVYIAGEQIDSKDHGRERIQYLVCFFYWIFDYLKYSFYSTRPGNSLEEKESD